MPPNNAIHRSESRLSRYSKSSHQKQADVQLHEGGKSRFEGVKHVARSSDYDSKDEDSSRPGRPYAKSVSATAVKHRPKTSDFGDHSPVRQQKVPHRHRKKSTRSNGESAARSVRLCPSPGRRPSAQFTLSSPESSGKDDSRVDDDIPKLSLPKSYIPQPRPPIKTSPLLNRDLLRLVSNGDPEGAEGLESTTFVLDMSEGESDVESEAKSAGGGGKGTTPLNSEVSGQQKE